MPTDLTATNPGLPPTSPAAGSEPGPTNADLPFAIGSTVWLKSGGPPMRAVATFRADGQWFYHCRWGGPGGTVQRQRFIPEVTRGDKRIILVDGEPQGAVNRMPVGDDIRSNMVRGGAASATELTAREREICLAIGPELRRRGLLFTGIDVIDGFLTEINVTSPTGLRAIKRLGGPDLAAAIWDAIERKLSGRPATV